MIAAFIVALAILAISTAFRTSSTFRPINRHILRSSDSDELNDIKDFFFRNFDSDVREDSIYACPESLKPLKMKQRVLGSSVEACFIEPEFGKTYNILPGKYIDLTLKKEVSKSFLQLSSREKVGQSFFQTRLVSAIYERGYRQNFENFGFPGIDLEFEEARDFFVDANATSVVMDLSCGSGFMTRKFIGSGGFDRVIAADLSPTMLAETRRRCVKEDLPMPEFVRCDSAKLPFRSRSISAIHAGAAMHCWPNLNESLAEIYRVLKPGGVFYASTFFTRSLGERDFLKITSNQQGFYLFSSAQEIEELVAKAGFRGEYDSACVVRREGDRCAIVKAVKGPVPAALQDSFIPTSVVSLPPSEEKKSEPIGGGGGGGSGSGSGSGSGQLLGGDGDDATSSSTTTTSSNTAVDQQQGTIPVTSALAAVKDDDGVSKSEEEEVVVRKDEEEDEV